MSGCGSGGSASDPAAPAKGGAGHPRTVENRGQEVKVAAAPQRAVSLNQGTTEILLSLGSAGRMAGTATRTDPVMKGLEKADSGVPRLADDMPALEAVLDTEPDFVAASSASTLGTGGVATRERFAQLGAQRPARLQGHRVLRVRYRTRTKAGTPISEVTTPTGTSWGSRTVRADVSTHATDTAPVGAYTGSAPETTASSIAFA